MFNDLWNKFLALTRSMNVYGLSLPMVKDPKTGLGSVSLTLVFISSITVILGLVGKWSGKLGVVDINNALEFFYASSFLYFGRNWRTGATAKEDVKGGQSKIDNPDDIPPTK
jgi:hypothetical protein